MDLTLMNLGTFLLHPSGAKFMIRTASSQSLMRVDVTKTDRCQSPHHRSPSIPDSFAIALRWPRCSRVV